MKAYTPPLCLWHLVEQHAPLHEQEEIKSMLGVSLVEQSQELHREIETLLEIWRDMRDETAESVSPQSTLPEPPDQRDRLVQEICFFVNSVKEKAQEKGIDPEFLLKKRNSQILVYAAELSTRPGSSKTSISSSSDGRETPMVPSSCSRDNLTHEIAEEVQAANQKLNYMDFDEVCESLRSTLEKEVEQLMEDIQFLQNYLYSEADLRDNLTAQPMCREPTLSELREERSQLEKDLLAANRITTTPQVVKPSFNTSNIVLPLTPASSSEISSPKTQQVPMKADHSLRGAVGGESEIKSVLSNKDISPSIQAKSATLSKPPGLDAQQNSSSVNKLDKGTVVNDDKNTRQTKPSLTLKESGTRSFVPNSPVALHKKTDVVQYLRRSPGTKAIQKMSGHNQTFVTSTTSMTKHDGATVAMGVVRRRTVSPGRVRVVEFAAIVDTHTSRDDSNMPCLSSKSSLATSSGISPSPPQNLSSAMRPSSAHADRFRNMVLECRDGE